MKDQMKGIEQGRGDERYHVSTRNQIEDKEATISKHINPLQESSTRSLHPSNLVYTPRPEHKQSPPSNQITAMELPHLLE